VSTERGQAHEIIRCLKRYIAREIYANLPHPQNDSLAHDVRPEAA
jgi:transposase